MIWPPSLLRIEVKQKGRRRISLWIPVLLFWLPALLIGILLAPLAGLLILLLPKRIGAWLKIGPRLFATFCSMRGTKVVVEEDGSRVCIFLI